jgi:hypothetical protein
MSSFTIFVSAPMTRSDLAASPLTGLDSTLGDLPGRAVFVLQPAALDFLAVIGGELAPVFVIAFSLVELVKDDPGRLVPIYRPAFSLVCHEFS